jgi:putative autoinducer-2 (AI-2) aldolase
MLTRGVLRTSVDPQSPTPVVLRVSGGTSILKELSNEEITVSIEDALRLNVSAMALSIFVGSEHEKETLVSLARLVDEGERYGIPVLAVTAVGKDMVRDARYLSLSCRIAAELGAHLVKTYYCEGFEEVVQSCPIPVIIAGGKKTPELEALQLTANAVQKGAVGVDMGRNIFQSDSPVGMIRAVRAIVHDKAVVEEAYKIYENSKGTKTRRAAG